MTSPEEKEMVCAEAVSTLLADGGQASSSESGCVETASNRFDFASDCIISPLHVVRQSVQRRSQERDRLPADPLTNLTYVARSSYSALTQHDFHFGHARLPPAWRATWPGSLFLSADRNRYPIGRVGFGGGRFRGHAQHRDVRSGQ